MGAGLGLFDPRRMFHSFRTAAVSAILTSGFFFAQKKRPQRGGGGSWGTSFHRMSGAWRHPVVLTKLVRRYWFLSGGLGPTVGLFLKLDVFGKFRSPLKILARPNLVPDLTTAS
jgi:hypothetical protein